MTVLVEVVVDGRVNGGKSLKRPHLSKPSLGRLLLGSVTPDPGHYRARRRPQPGWADRLPHWRPRAPPRRPCDLPFLKISLAAEILAFQPTAGDRLRPANDRRDPRCLGPRDCPEPRNVPAGKYPSAPTSGGPEAGKTMAVASAARPLVLGFPFPPVAALEGRPCHRRARDSHRLAPPGVPPVLEMEIPPRKVGSPAKLEGIARTHPTNEPREPA